MTLSHYTLNTGDLRLSPRSEVDDDAIRALDPIILAGGGICPGLPDIRLVIKRRQPGRAIILLGDEKGTAIVAVLAWQQDAAEAVWPSFFELARSQSASLATALPPALAMPASLPWLAVHITPVFAFLRPPVMVAIGDLERCLAWAILCQEGLAV